MKVLSDNTADRLLRHLDAAEGSITPRRIPRGASTTPPAPMWQIHVTAAGAVTVDGGDVYANGTRHTLLPADLGTASGASLVVWHDGEDGGEITLESSSWEPEGGETYRIIGEVRQDDATSPWYSRQYVGEPIEVGGGGVNPGPGSGAVKKVLGGTDYDAATDSWTYGETDVMTGKPTYPDFNPTRLYWQESAHTLWMFRRTETFNSSGMLVKVSAEARTSVFTTVAEMP